jgi:hypothetical protein
MTLCNHATSIITFDSITPHLHEFILYCADEENLNSTGGGPWIYKLRYNIQHRFGPLMASGNQAPWYAQLYFFDPEGALHQRVQNNNNLSVQTLQVLRDTLNHTNPYSSLLLQAFHDVQQNPGQQASMRLLAHPSKDRRHYNPPTVNEIAAVIYGDFIPSGPRDIVLHQTDGSLQHVSIHATLLFIVCFCSLTELPARCLLLNFTHVSMAVHRTHPIHALG